MSSKEDFKNVLLSKPHCNIGKLGITEDMINHIEQLLKDHKIIKVKVLKSFAYDKDIDNISEKVARKSDAYLQDVRGKTFILSKKRIKDL
ncbi:MAG: YhbY family RNA-binding protein [Promethearchaeia archaeon]